MGYELYAHQRIQENAHVVSLVAAVVWNITGSDTLKYVGL